eukprot:CAMPEP_0179076186 /NCGR_PEP_ID=MMETSP0796-20121207/33974_1 /TAXON_ID=73915 /ORGANISM="Pyrodinium bahamense, Strain pbaha01" /LENGTH=93 /DNA_ID=CAMNT_0020773437 /DNA_START=205 /DNA_END=486 /DNA_ORIENTATION=-
MGGTWSSGWQYVEPLVVLYLSGPSVWYFSQLLVSVPIAAFPISSFLSLPYSSEVLTHVFDVATGSWSTFSVAFSWLAGSRRSSNQLLLRTEGP